MFPDFLELFGLDLYGLAFERAFWLLCLSLGIWGVYGGVSLLREEDKSTGIIRLIVSGGVVAYVGFHGYQAWFLPGSYQLLFSQELVLHTYALAIVTGFLIGTWLGAREGDRVGISKSRILDIAFWCLIMGFVGARLVFMLVSAGDYVDACVAPEKVGLTEPDCYKALKFWEGGLVFYGAFLGAATWVVFYTRRHNIRLLKLLDTAAPTIALMHAFGRLGCLGAGCCWGEVCTSGWGVHFPRGAMPYEDAVARLRDGDSAIDPHVLEQGTTQALHPTQLYEVFGELTFFVILLLWRPYKRAHGELISLWLAMYGFFRIFTEMMRGDRVRGYMFEVTVGPINTLFRLPSDHVTLMTTSQFIGLCLGVLGAVLFVLFRRRGARQELRA